MSWPGSPRTRNRPRGPGSPIPAPPGLFRDRRRSRSGRVDKSGRWPLIRLVEDSTIEIGGIFLPSRV